MALSHFSCQTGTGRGSIASWAAFRTCLRVLQKVFNNLVVQNSSILFTFNELSTAFLCAHMCLSVCACVHVNVLWGRAGSGMEEAKEETEFIGRISFTFYSKTREKFSHFPKPILLFHLQCLTLFLRCLFASPCPLFTIYRLESDSNITQIRGQKANPKHTPQIFRHLMKS